MEENSHDVTRPRTGVVTETIDRICDACGELSLSKILNAPSISLRYNHSGLDHSEWMREQILNPPIILKVSRIQSNQAHCSVCSLIHQQLGNDLLSAEDFIQVYGCEDLESKVQSLWMYFQRSEKAVLKITLFADEGSFASNYIPYRPVADRASDQSIQDIKNWITTCNKSHPRCRFSISGAKMKHKTHLPTRVIYVGDSGEEVRLVISNQMAARYVALSHCWGGTSNYCTTKSRLEQDKKGLIKIADLSKTIQDAIFIVRKLELHYLWVDSLCIIQDDEDDWLLEAGRMAAVYEGAYLTIAASASTDGSGGCFVSQGHQELLRLPCQKDDPASGHMYFGIAMKAPLKECSVVHSMHEHGSFKNIYLHAELTGDSDKGVALLHTWRLLGSSRMPHLVKVPPQEPFCRADYYSWWANAICFFSKCGLTKETDKLPALLSLSTELGKLTDNEYHEGHWHSPGGTLLFISSLLWHADNGHHLKKPDNFRAPSWSWASLEGPLDFADMFHHNLSHIFSPADTDLQLLKVPYFQPIGLPRRKVLLLSAVLIRVFKIRYSSEPKVRGPHDCTACDKAEKQTCIRVSDENGEEIDGAFMFDLVDAQPSNFWLLPAFCRWTDPNGPAPIYYTLLVAEVPDQRAAGLVCERVGVGHIEDARIVYGRSRQCVVLI